MHLFSIYKRVTLSAAVLPLSRFCTTARRRRCHGRVCVLYLHAVVMRALSIEVAAMIVDAAVIQGAEAHEAVLQRVVPLLVHVVVPDYILFTGKPLQKQKGGILYSQIRQQVTSSM